MLPGSLLITRRRQDKISPVYAQINQRNVKVAGMLIQTYRDYLFKKKGELSDTVNGLEDIGYDYRYVRGLSTLLDRRCQLESRAAISPVKARRQVFKIAHKTGFPTAHETRRAILHQAATRLQVSVEELEGSLYGDLEDELILKDFKPVNPEALIKQYNLSLAQTLLFYSTELTFTTGGNWQRIFRQIKWLGLIYAIKRSDGGYEVKVDGPASLFKLNRRYGTSLAKLLPTIVQNEKWRVKAKILRRKGEWHLLDMELDSEKHREIMKALEKPEGSNVYDSHVEEDFANRFKALETGWALVREPEPLPVGRRVMIPDFGFEKGSLRVYLEVAGFWTSHYLEEKIKKLSLLGNTDMIVAANKDLACQKLHKIGEKLNLIYYRRSIPLRPILDHLRAKEEHLIKEQIRRLCAEPLLFEKPVVEARELAEKFGVLEEAAKEVLKKKEVPGYMRLGDMFIKETKLKEIQEELETRLDQAELSIGEAHRIIQAAGGVRPTSILDALGYKIEWHGIDPQSARIRRRG